MSGKTVEAKKSSRHYSSGMIVFQTLLHQRSCIIGIILVILLCLSAIFAPWLTPYSYSKISAADAFALPSLKHLCGCDAMGRDIFTRLLYGGRYSIGIGILSTLVGTAGGMAIGAIAGFFGGKVDLVVMRIVDIFQALPSILLAIVVAAVLGAGYIPTILALGIASIPGTVRLMRASILTVRGMDYVEAATSINCKNFRIIWHYIIPNAMAPVLVNISNSVSSAVISAASLSYIGLGVQPPYPEWGAMLTAGKDYITSYSYLTLFPGLFILVFVFAFNLFSDALRDALDPKLKK